MYSILVSCLLIAGGLAHAVPFKPDGSVQPVGPQQSPALPVAESQALVAACPWCYNKPKRHVGSNVEGEQGEQQQSPAVPVVESQPQSVSVVQKSAPGSVLEPPKVYTRVAKEHYGQPESASIPSNYKPFGSWGLYIGGNPADGYYTNYYKGMSGGSSGVQPVVGPSEVYKHSGSPFESGNYFYSSSDFQSGAPISHYSPSVMGPVPPMMPVEGVPYYAPESYSSGLKRVGSPVQQVRELTKSSPKTSSSSGVKGGQQQQVQAKGYSPVSVLYGSSPMVGNQQQPQVVAYSVPVGSQIVGYHNGASEQSVPSAYNGIQAFTRYAVKPVVASGPQSYYYPLSYFGSDQIHKQAHASAPCYQPFCDPLNQVSPAQSAPQSYYYPLSYFGSDQVHKQAHASAPCYQPFCDPLNQVSPAQSAPVDPVSAPVAPVVEAPGPVSNVEAPASPVAPAAPLLASPAQAGRAQSGVSVYSSQEISQQQEQQQVVEQKQVEKSAVKGQ